MPQTYDIAALKAKYMPDASATPTPSNLGTSKDGQQYDVEALRQKYLGSTALPTVTAPKTPQEEKDIASAEKFKPTFASETGEGGVSSVLKTIGNIPSSAWSFAKGVVQTLNPVNTVKNIKEIATAIPEIVSNAKYTGGAFNTTKDIGIDTAKSLYEGVVPEAVRSTLSGDLENTGRAITNDPVGQILPLFIAAKGGAKFADTRVSKANMADYVDNIAENTKNRVPIPKPSTKYNDMIDNGVSAITKPIATVFGKTGELTDKAVKTTVGQATGLNPETITQITKTPEQFTKENMVNVDRRSLGQAVQSRLQSKIASLEETGSEYKPIRTSKQEVAVDKNFIDNTVKDLAKVDIKKGKITTSGKADIRDAKDVRALQSLYDLWKPVFNKGKLTTEEFLNFRSDLAKLSKFERDLGKSAPIEGMTARMRAKFNEAYRPQIEGLDKLDESFSTQNAELKRLSKGLVDKEGNLTDAAINRIANATGKGKDLLLDKLEEVLPGVTQKIKILKAVEDIQHASGIKVGTYGRGALIGGGLVMGGPIQAAITAILTSPELAVPIIRKYGLMKNSNAIKSVVAALQSGGNNVKDLMNNKPSAFNPSIKMPETLSAGLAVQDIFAGKSNITAKNGVALTKVPNDGLSLAELKQKAFLIDRNGGDISPLVKAIQDRGTFTLNKSFNKEDLFQKNIYKFKGHSEYMKNKYTGFAEQSGLDKAGFTDSGIKWIDNWLHADQVTPTPEIVSQFSKYKPKEATDLYWGGTGDGFTLKRNTPMSLTTDLDVAREFGSAGRRDNPIIVKISKVKPDDMVVATEKVPKEVAKALDMEFSAEKEVITKINLNELSKKYEVSISKDDGQTWEVAGKKGAFSPKK